MTVVPGHPDSAAVSDVEEPRADDGSVLVATRAIGICGTDHDIVQNGYGAPPPGSTRLVLGHESLGTVLDAPTGSGLSTGDLVVGVVRRPDPVPCPACAVGQWDMCLNGRYVERGIKERDGYGSERYRIDPAFAIRVEPSLGDLGVLLEPASIVAKAWEQVERIGHRAYFGPQIALITGAGPIGLLAALMARQRGLETHVVDVVTSGPKPALVTEIEATYHSEPVADVDVGADVVVECTGIGTVAVAATGNAHAAAIIALTGIRDSDTTQASDLNALNRALVLGNKVMFGSVNAARRHYELGAQALARADPSWLGRLISRRVPLDRWTDGLVKQNDDIKVVVDLAADGASPTR